MEQPDINNESLEIRILKINGQISVSDDNAKLLEILGKFGNITVDKDYNTIKHILICNFEKYPGPVEDIRMRLKKTKDYRLYAGED